MNTELTIMIVKIVGIFLGVLLRTWLPARRKLMKARKRGEGFSFRNVYLKTAAVSLVVAAFTSFMVLPSFSTAATDLMICFGAALNIGFGSNAIANEIYQVFFEKDEGSQ